MTNPISKTNLGILETANPASQRESNAKFNSVRFEKNGPDSSCEAKVMVVLSLDSESGFLARRWKGGGGFVGMVGLVIGSVYRDWVCGMIIDWVEISTLIIQGSERTAPRNHYTTALLIVTHDTWVTSAQKAYP
jgi:hypothetical protein